MCHRSIFFVCACVHPAGLSICRLNMLLLVFYVRRGNFVFVRSFWTMLPHNVRNVSFYPPSTWPLLYSSIFHLSLFAWKRKLEKKAKQNLAGRAWNWAQWLCHCSAIEEFKNAEDNLLLSPRCQGKENNLWKERSKHEEHAANCNDTCCRRCEENERKGIVSSHVASLGIGQRIIYARARDMRRHGKRK